MQYASGHIWGGQETILRRLVVGDRKTGVAGINADTLLFSHSLGQERTLHLLFPLRPRLRDFAGLLNEKPCNRTERAVGQGDDAD